MHSINMFHQNTIPPTEILALASNHPKKPRSLPSQNSRVQTALTPLENGNEDQRLHTHIN
jgi:hypothetical protein